MKSKKNKGLVKKLTVAFGLAASLCVGYLALKPLIDPNHPDAKDISIASFNIQFLGNSTYRDDVALAHTVKDHDIVVVQELVSPPYNGSFPDGTPFKPDPEAREFFDEMKSHGFLFILSEEDTGTGATIHKNGSSTEWFVAFYKPETIEPAYDLSHGYIAFDRSDNPDYERVPFAFPFRSKDQTTDFVLISVHLQPGPSSKNEARRLHELKSITAWINNNNQLEKDFIILGDMNIEDCEELTRVTPENYQSLNNNCTPTNTNINKPKPYDHIMVHSDHTLNEIDKENRFQVINLITTMRDHWTQTNNEPYPGEPYDHNRFRKYYSDHHPITFQINTGLDLD